MKLKLSLLPIFLLTLTLFILFPNFALSSSAIDDTDALKGNLTAKALFDINVSTASKLELYLQVIKQTRSDLLNQGMTPDFVIAFRGASVKLITSDNQAFSDRERQYLARSSEYLKELSKLGVKLEACSIATELFKINNEKLLPGVKVVRNTFISLIGYQGQGYKIIPIQ